ncbi:MAG: hypothetical protein AAF710_06760 [Planctomycetota bacterium]
MSLHRVLALALLPYSVALLAIELATSQEHVRNYFTDLEGPVVLYGVNTTLSVSLLWGCGLLCGVAVYLRGDDRPWATRGGRFLCLQAALLAYLGLDDRFLIHERIDGLTGLSNAVVLGGVGVAQLAVLVWYRAEWDSAAARRCLIAAASLFLVMMVIDALGPAGMVLRLSVEDLCKTWSAFFLFLFGCEIVRQQHAVSEQPRPASTTRLD